MYLFKDSKNNYYTYIHIPKNSGKYIRKKIDEKYTKVLYMWGSSGNIDNAHLSYLDCLKKIKSLKYPDDEITNKPIFFFTFVRNPYDRLISIYHYLEYNNKMNFGMFLKDIINKPIKNRFNRVYLKNPNNIIYDHTFIHLYPQYLFLLDENNNVSPNIKIEKLEECCKNHYLLNFNDFQIKKYEYSRFYTTKEDYEIVNDFYNKDFEYFGYEKIILP